MSTLIWIDQVAVVRKRCRRSFWILMQALALFLADDEAPASTSLSRSNSSTSSAASSSTSAASSSSAASMLLEEEQVPTPHHHKTALERLFHYSSKPTHDINPL